MPLARALIFAVICEVLVALSSLYHLPIILQVTAQPDYVSIDCGGATANYTDKETGLSWISDSDGFGLEDVSRTATVSSPLAKYTWLSNMRIFEGNQRKYCYEFDNAKHRIVDSDPYLVRASFWAGDTAPSSVSTGRIQFKLLINADEWESIDISFPQSDPLVLEMYVIARPQKNSVCMAPDQGMTAFVSSLELRRINSNSTNVIEFMQPPSHANGPIALLLYARLDLGSANEFRYNAREGEISFARSFGHFRVWRQRAGSLSPSGKALLECVCNHPKKGRFPRKGTYPKLLQCVCKHPK